MGFVERVGGQREGVSTSYAASESPRSLVVGDRFKCAGPMPQQTPGAPIDRDVSLASRTRLGDRQQVEADLVQPPSPIEMKRKPTPHPIRQCRRSLAAPSAWTQRRRPVRRHCRVCRFLSVLVLGVNALRRRGVCALKGQSVRADAQPYLGPRSGVAPERRHDG
jgi:hypothetical protein